jgi:7-carboxy-7-deazaguanine synthase
MQFDQTAPPTAALLAEGTRKDKKLPVVEMFGPTLSGEGNEIGRQTWFIRFGLCDYKCKMCDSMHAVDPALVKARATWMTQDEIADHLIAEMGHTQWVTFSGGNPCIHDLTQLCTRLREADKLIAVETQGTKAPEWLRLTDSITISPKGPGMGEDIKWEDFGSFMAAMDEIVQHDYEHPEISLKVVVFHQMDIEFAYHVERFVAGVYKGLQMGTVDAPKIPWFPALYLSLGNPWPKNYYGQGEEMPLEHLRTNLLESMRLLADDIVRDPRMAEWRLLPQMHVLIWGTKDGV